MPADFAEHAYETVAALKKRYAVPHEYVREWRNELGISGRMVHERACALKSRLKKMPEGFAEYQEGRSQRELAKHYGFAVATIQRFLTELGIDRMAVYAAERASKGKVKPEARVVELPQRPKASTFTLTAVDRPYVDPTRVGQAAEYLRRFGPVVRCDEQGRYDPAGNRWRRGSSLLNADEIIQRAVRNGWRDLSIAA